MKTGTKFFITLVGLAILCGWTTRQTNEIKKAEWLIGTWENKTHKGCSSYFYQVVDFFISIKH